MKLKKLIINIKNWTYLKLIFIYDVSMSAILYSLNWNILIYQKKNKLELIKNKSYYFK